jgi:uncharacterized protein YkwD
VTVAAPAATLALPTPAAQARYCPRADLQPTPHNLAKVSRATRCLLNRQRHRHHLHGLRPDPALRRAASRYARQMVRQRFFEHTSPLGTTFVQRIARTAYLADANGWSLGENLAWGSEVLARPRQIVRAWMHSPGHRRNILDPRFREVGIGIVLGTPRGSAPGATYVNEFGRRGG